MQFLISGLEKSCAFQANNTSKVLDLKNYLKTEFNQDLSECYLTNSGKILNDAQILNESCSGFKIELKERLLGGKVHGSLASSGKVKGLTPKVDKMVKSRKTTGRAKRRIQHNKRFENVVTFGARKKGPNSNNKPT